jgi:hypothetical protein
MSMICDRFTGRTCVLALVLLIGSTTQGEAVPVSGERPDDRPPASVRAGLLYPDGGLLAAVPQAGAQRSVPLAFGLSAVLPGLGQAYNGQWLKAAVALALEAALLTGYVISQQNGEDGRDKYQAYAHAEWDPTQYARWLNDYRTYLEVENPARPIDAPAVEVPGDLDFSNPGAWTGAEYRAMRAFFDQIRTLERDLYHPSTGATFSHVLPYFGEQQYYELIGKYFQFMPGWADYPSWATDEGGYTPAIDPETPGSSGLPEFSAQFWRYADDHADANDYFRRASRLTAFLIVNHVVAAIDAAVSAKLHNDRIDAGVELGYGRDGTWQPRAMLRVRL